MISTQAENELILSALLPPRMLTVKETAFETGIAPFRIRQLCLENKIVHIRAGRKVLVNFDKFIEFLWNSGIEPPQAAEADIKKHRGIRPVNI